MAYALNGDGKPDVVVTCDRSNVVTVLLGKGDGTFQPSVNPYAVGLGDLAGDGFLDIVTANDAADTVGVLLGSCAP